MSSTSEQNARYHKRTFVPEEIHTVLAVGNVEGWDLVTSIIINRNQTALFDEFPIVSILADERSRLSIKTHIGMARYAANSSFPGLISRSKTSAWEERPRRR
jgi:hypothetical protein